MNLKERCDKIKILFDSMDGEQASNWQVNEVRLFRTFYPELNEDLDFCFEVLAGKHKMGVTLYFTEPSKDDWNDFNLFTIKEIYNFLIRRFEIFGRGQDSIAYYSSVLKALEIASFMVPLINREYRLGYSNKAAMVTDKSPMLAKKWNEERHKFRNQYIYIQEKYDGNRCISWKDKNGTWKFQSRSGKPMNVNFNMEAFAPGEDLVFDGEIITKRGEFNKSAGIIASQDGPKDQLIYMIYDIIAPELSFHQRNERLNMLLNTDDIKTAPILDQGCYEPIIITQEGLYNADIDKLLGDMVAQGGEGIMIRIGDSKYEPGKRSLGLLKYKLVQSMDMLCTGFIPGTGKYEDMIGSLNVELKTDDGQHITTSVGTGLKDWERDLDPSHFIGKIIEVEYFEKCQNQAAGPNEWSLRFPRFKGVRNDKTTTSSY